MKTTIITKDPEKRLMDLVFEMDTEDTCMKTWTFEVEGTPMGTRIVSCDINFAKQGCSGHPKTISALVKGRYLSDINVDDLMKTTCFRPQSCGMSLGHCVHALQTNQDLQFNKEQL